MNKLLLALGILLLSTNIASAGTYSTDAGYFYCTNCVMTDPAPDPDTSDFIHAIVNQYVTSWQTPDGQLMHVEICNASICVTWQYTAGGSFLSSGVTTNDGSHQYKNSSDQYDVSTGGGAGGYSGTNFLGSYLTGGGGTCVVTIYSDGSVSEPYDCQGG